ncbi:peroxiredoxin-like 2A isoform X2 [Telopea speciosissima]|nr:peroxiredoxin-like 2A isoform X2 [Telopea speciosissima]
MRSYLHDRKLMQFADKLEASGKPLSELLRLSTLDLSSEFDMRRAHINRFTDSTTPYHVPASSIRRNTTLSMSESAYEGPPNITEGHNFRGIVAAKPAEPRFCGFIQPPPVVDDVAPYSAIKNISVQKLNEDCKIGKEQLMKTKAPQMKALELWLDKPVVLVCIRRPGCIMCRAQAHLLYSRKPTFDALGIQLVAVLHEYIESEVREFWPHYWGGVIILDLNLDFFKALGGGKLLKDKFITGFVFNPRAIANYKRAKGTGFEYNTKGEGEIKGGLFIVRSGNGGIAYQFIERNFGDWAPIEEVVDICTQLQKKPQDQGYFT